MIDGTDTVFRLVAVLKLAALVEEAMPQLLSGRAMAPEVAPDILSGIAQLRTDIDRQEVHSPGELRSIAARAEILDELLADRAEYLTESQREAHASIMRVLSAKPGRELTDALRELR